MAKEFPFKSILLVITILVYIWSAIKPHGYFIWFLEVFPAFIGAIVMLFTRKTFPLSNVLFGIIMIHMMILAVGGHYTYAEVPFGNYAKELFGTSRNEYDRLGHIFQGLTPALLFHEIITRKTQLKSKTLTFIFCISCPLAFSALYEIFEWIVAISTGEGADFISMQGDIWDTQKDMLCACIGAIFAMIFLTKIQLRSINKIKND